MAELMALLNKRATLLKSATPFGSEYSAVKVCANPYPAAGVALTVTVALALKKPPALTVPPGVAAVVKRYCVVRLAL